MKPATGKIKECVEPQRNGCKGCKHSIDPKLFDGGCKLLLSNSKGRIKDNER